MILYPYQNTAIDALREGYRNHQRQILCLPTGSGKTVVFSHICAAAIERGKRVLILSDRAEIFEQTIKTIIRSHSHGVSICKIDRKNKYINKQSLLFIGMVESFYKIINRFAKTNGSQIDVNGSQIGINDNAGMIGFDLIIVDEAHKGCYFKIFDYFTNTRVLGCTATPINTRLHKYYTNLLQPIDVPELIDSGFLTPCKAYQMVEDISDIKVKSNGEFDEQSHFKHFAKSKLYNGVIDKWLEKTPLQKTLVYCVNIKHAEETCAAFNERGISARCITSKTKEDERAHTLLDFTHDKFYVLVNCGCLTTGTDIPSATCIVINRAVSVLSLFIQIVGRGSRTFPGKSFFTCIDFGMNHERHGLWQQARQWTLSEPKKAKTPGVAPIKYCAQCDAIISAMARRCEYCDFIFPIEEKKLLNGQLVEVSAQVPGGLRDRAISDLTVNELIQLEKSKRYKTAYIWRIIRTRGEVALGEYAEIKGYKDGWIRSQLELMDNGGIGFSNIKIK